MLKWSVGNVHKQRSVDVITTRTGAHGAGWNRTKFGPPWSFLLCQPDAWPDSLDNVAVKLNAEIYVAQSSHACTSVCSPRKTFWPLVWQGMPPGQTVQQKAQTCRYFSQSRGCCCYFWSASAAIDAVLVAAVAPTFAASSDTHAALFSDGSSHTWPAGRNALNATGKVWSHSRYICGVPQRVGPRAVCVRALYSRSGSSHHPHSLQPQMYADGSQIFGWCHPADMDSLPQHVSVRLAEVANWMSNRLQHSKDEPK